MASYSSARALFDEIVRRARSERRLIDDRPFIDASIRLDTARSGLLSITAEDELAEEPDYRVVFAVTTVVSTGSMLELPPLLELTDLLPDKAWDSLGVI
jgi:hypothetical protein